MNAMKKWKCNKAKEEWNSNGNENECSDEEDI